MTGPVALYPSGMRLTSVLPALLLVLALSGCGDDEPEAADPPKESPEAAQASAILDCTTEQGLSGSIGQIEGGIPAIDLSTEDETIVVHVLGSEAEAESYEASLDHTPVANTAVLGGAISAEHQELIRGCIEDSAAG